MRKDILLCGVGGQGTVLASKLIAAAAMRAGETVRSAETIGMAQRGGSVTSHVRISTAYSPLIPENSADLMLAFEPAEAVRNLPLLKKDGLVIVNTVPVKPITDSGYDGREMLAYLEKKCGRLIKVNAAEMGLPSPKFFNTAILGAACGSGELGISKENILAEINEKIPEKFRENNISSFLRGMETGEKYAAE